MVSSSSDDESLSAAAPAPLEMHLPSQPKKKRRIQIHESSSSDDDENVDDDSSSSSSFLPPNEEEEEEEEDSLKEDVYEDDASSSDEDDDEEEELREEEMFERWRSDRPLVRKLSRQNVGMYDFKKISTDFRAVPVPPARDAVGEYDVVFVMWDAMEEEPWSHVFFSRTVSCGSSLLLLVANGTGGGGGEDDDDMASYSRLQGEIRLEGLSLSDNDDDDDNQSSLLPPYGTRTRFSFSSADVDVLTTMVRATPDGEDFAGMDTLPPPESNNNNNNDETASGGSLQQLPPFETDRFDLWSEQYWTEVTLEWFEERRGLNWIPNDACGGNHPYARALRRKLQKRQRRGEWTTSEAPSSWLHRITPLPGPIVEKILGYNTAFVPETTEPFWIESGDLQVSIRFGANLGDSLDLRVVARKKKK